MALRRASLFLFLTVIFSLVWASASGQVSLSISPGNPDAGGRVAVVESIDQTVTMTWGKAQVVYGKSIFKIDKIMPGMANRLLIHVILCDPYDMCKVFGNPHAYINVTVSNSSDTPGEVYAWGILSKEHAEVMLRPQNVPASTTTLYIQVSIRVPGGPPPGQQEKQSLQYYCRVELR
jgi:hypothetical protein